MNLEKLKALYERYEKNKVFLGFEVSISEDTGSEKLFQVNITNLDERYKDSLVKLIGDMAEEAKTYISSEYLLKFLKTEKEFEYLRFDSEMRAEFVMLLNCLFENGLNTFLTNVSYLSIKYKQLYELAHVKLVNGKLVDRHGNEIAS